jgi:hypothetical protein
VIAARVIFCSGAKEGRDEEGGQAVLRRDAGRVPVPLRGRVEVVAGKVEIKKE